MVIIYNKHTHERVEPKSKESENIRLMHGDCLKLMKDIATGSVDMIMTDPPYGTTNCSWDSVIPFKEMWEQLKRIIKINGAIVLMACQPFTSALVMSQLEIFKYEWVWKKNPPTGFLNAKKQPLRDNESILVFYKEQCLYNPQFTQGKPYVATRSSSTDSYNYSEAIPTVSDGRRYPKSIQEFTRENFKIHPTQKPITLMEYLIKTYTNENETVLDFTMGSGTTGVACINLNRKFIGIELNGGYFAMAKVRIKHAIEDKRRREI